MTGRQVKRYILAAFLCGAYAVLGAPNLLEDPSFEEAKERDQFGLVFARWGGWKYEGDCSFEVGRVAHSGQLAACLTGVSGPKIRITAPDRELPAGRYRVTAFIRGLDIGTGVWNQTTEFMFDGKYLPLGKNGTFGWTPLTYVADVTGEKKVSGPSFGLMAPGFFWIDDVTLERVPDDTPPTPEPVLGTEEAPVEPPGDFGPGEIRCGTCGYRAMPAWGACYACGSPLDAPRARAAGPPQQLITSFEEEENPCTGPAQTVVENRATDGVKALRMDRGWASLDRAQDWTGYDYLHIDFFADSEQPIPVYVEVRDTATRDYWTRVNYTSVVPPGASTLSVPVNQLYVGEKSRPGRMLMLNAITRLAIAHSSENPPGPLFIDNIRLERDDSAEQARFDGLHAFDFGTGTSPVMEGFTEITPATLYSKGRGYGLADARVWRAFDVLQPEPLYQDFICIEAGGLAVDLPNGTYRVFLNMDNPSGFWGEFQTYTRRAVRAEGREVAVDTLDFERQKARYFRFWNSDDSPAENTFDKYQMAYYAEKEFEVEVADGQLNLEFEGANWACSVAAVVIFPISKRTDGERFLEFARDRRRRHFDNAFKRVLHKAETRDPAPTAEDRQRGYVLFRRDLMQDVYYNDTPGPNDRTDSLAADAFPGEHEPLTLSLYPLRDLGAVETTVSDLAGPAGTIPADRIAGGYVSYRLTRVTMEGSVYTIAPRFIMPTGRVDCPKEIVRRFVFTVRVPPDASPGLYRGTLTVRPAVGEPAAVPVTFRVRRGTLAQADVPAGPWGHTIGLPWDDDEARRWKDTITGRCLATLRDAGFTSFSGMPELRYLGFRDGEPQIDFSRGDAQMALAREAGFTMPLVNYCAFAGLNLYERDTAAMEAADLKDYTTFVQAIFSKVRDHAEAAGWLPVYWNLGDEPLGDALTRSAENAEAYREAFPKGPPFFTAASSYDGNDPTDPHFRLAKALHVVNWNLHSEDSVALLHDAGSDWAFYNGGNRWTFGTYMFKSVKEFGMVFRLSWHWNCNAGDPYYALDCREDDYAWCNATPDGRLVPALEFERVREGLDDYRYLLTLTRLLEDDAKKNSAAGRAAKALVDDRMAAFKLGRRDHDALFGPDDWIRFRAAVGDAIEALQ